MSTTTIPSPHSTPSPTTPQTTLTPCYLYTEPPPIPKPLIQYQRRTHNTHNPLPPPRIPPIPSPPPTTRPPTPQQLTIHTPHPMTTRSHTKPPTPTYQTNIATPEPDPQTYKQAHQNHNWTKAMQTEIQALHQQHTWILVPKPPHHTILGSKWTFKTKLHPDGTVSRYKARLVAQGFRQTEGLDYHDTFSPVAKLTTIRLFFILALNRNWNINQIDVSNAFLHGNLQEEVYMTQPKGFEDPTKPSHVCLLKKSLYGLKQSSRQWNIALTTYLKGQHFQMSTADPSLYLLHIGASHVYLLIYVDDLLVTGNDPMLTNQVITSLGLQFNIRSLGHPKTFLGIQTDSTKEDIAYTNNNTPSPLFTWPA